MTVVLPAEHKARFYTSPNLKDWTLLSEFGPQGFTASNWECPFLIQLPVEGSNQKKWVVALLLYKRFHKQSELEHSI